MDTTLVRALVAGARAFADELERGLPVETGGPPSPGSAKSMLEVLRSVAAINEHQARGASDEEIRVIARRAGMDPRGMAGYYAASLLEKRDDGRWVSTAGRERLLALSGLVVVHSPQGAPGPGLVDLEAMYTTGSPAWDIGRPQPAFLHLAETGALKGRVLDIGCGTGEHALMAADLGLPVTGVDASPTAISIAKQKAARRHKRDMAEVRFLVWDARDLPSLGEQFDTVLDCGLFHIFDDADRARYVDALRALVAPRGRYLVLCFSDRMPGTVGPRRISQDEIRASFADGWRIESIEPSTLEISVPTGPAHAWLAVITRVDDGEKASGE